MLDLSPEAFLRSYSSAVRALETTEFCCRKVLGVLAIQAVAAQLTAYVAARMDCAFVDAAALTEGEFIAAAQPMIDFLNRRWPPG